MRPRTPRDWTPRAEARCRGVAIALGLLLSLLSAGLHAQALAPLPGPRLAAPSGTVAPAGAPLSRAEEQRLERITHSFRENQGAERRWYWVWTAGLGALAAGQLVALALFDEPARRASLIYGASASSVGVLTLLVRGNPALHAADELDAMPSATPAERRRKLRRADELLDDSADVARLDPNPWLGLVVPMGAATVMSSVLLFHYDAPVEAATQLLGSAAISSLRFFTRPLGNLETHRELQREQVSLELVPGPSSLTLVGRF